MSGALPLAGLRVRDLSRGGGATACARLLAQLGATLEGAAAEAPGAQARRQAAAPEVVLSDWPPDEAQALGLGRGDLRGARCVSVSVTDHGLEGPGVALGDPLPRCAGIDADVAAALAGAHAAVATLAALRWARYHRRTAAVEVATLEVLASCLGDQLPCATHPHSADQPPSDAARVAEAVALGAALPAVLRCADGYVGVAAPTARDRADLAALIGAEQGLAEPVDLATALEPWLRSRTRDEVFRAAQLWRLPVVPVLEPDEVVGDAQSVARGVWSWQGARPVARSPFRFAPGPDARRRAGRPTPLPLSDLRVLDLGMVWAGPYCGRLLAGLGARVIKVEGPNRPDGTRRPGAGGGSAKRGCAGLFAHLNRGKASLVLDLSRAAGRAVFLRLASRVDAVIESFSPRVMSNLGLDYSVLAETNPALLMLSMPAFGADGPWASYVAYGSGLELATGLFARDGAGRPAPAPTAYLDFLAGAYGAAGLLAGLLARDAWGQGTHVELAQREVACQVLAARWGCPPNRGGAQVAPGALREDARLVGRGLFAAPEEGPACHRYVRLPWRLHGLPLSRERAAPRFGADSRRILRELAGMAAEDSEGLARVGVVGAPPRRSSGGRRRSEGAGADG